jgi:hypothetical protein
MCTATNRVSQTQHFIVTKLCALCWSQWPRGLRRGSAAARLMGVLVRIPPDLGCSSLLTLVCSEVEVSASSRRILPSVACLSVIVKFH